MCARGGSHVGAVRLHERIKEQAGMIITYNKIHRVLGDEDPAAGQSNNSKRRKWIRYERAYSDSMWHTDCKKPDDGRWFLRHGDDASRFVTGYGAFEHAAAENALPVLEQAIKNRGKPASIMTDHGSQFCAKLQKQRGKAPPYTKRG